MFEYTPSWPLLLLPVSLAYIAAVSILRYQRLRSMHAKFNYPTRASFARMTTDDAWAIQMYLAELEFPKIFSTSVFFALFKTYGIPTVSCLLVATGQLGNPTTSSKRYADTGALLLETVLNPPTSERSIAAIARINYLHNHHRKSGKILDKDMLYTLSLFALEPSRWVARYEWRSLTEMELCAIGTFWKSLGDDLLVPYDELPSSKAGWKDGLHWLEEIDQWSVQYEKENMVPDANNKKLGETTVKILFFGLPRWLHAVGMKAFTRILDQRLRASMMFPDPPMSYHKVVKGTLYLRKLFIRYFCLPRSRPVPYFTNSATPGRFHMLLYRGHPWYVEPTLGNRWGIYGWWLWLQGEAIPGDGGQKYIPQGYDPRTMGPNHQHGRGFELMDETREKLLQQGRGGCIFATGA